jgi:hypothetical protein
LFGVNAGVGAGAGDRQRLCGVVSFEKFKESLGVFFNKFGSFDRGCWYGRFDNDFKDTNAELEGVVLGFVEACQEVDLCRCCWGGGPVNGGILGI